LSPLPPENAAGVGIGIDWISWKRLERFLAEHPFEFLKRVLSSPEQTAFRKARSPLRYFGRSFAAKEAYFKAAELSGMGEEVLCQFEARPLGRNRFHIRTTPESRFKIPPAEGRFFESREGIGAALMLHPAPPRLLSKKGGVKAGRKGTGVPKGNNLEATPACRNALRRAGTAVKPWSGVHKGDT